MRMSRLSLLFLAVLAPALGGCFARGPQYAPQPRYAQQQYPPQSYVAAPQAESTAAPVVYAAPAMAAPVAPSYSAAATRPAPRGFFTAPLGGPFARAPAYAAPVYAAPASSCGARGCGVAAPAYAAPAYAAAYPQASLEAPYLLDAGDRLRISVFGQDGLTNSYAVDAAGNITMPLVGTLRARGLTTAQLSGALSERLKQGYIREPKVAIEVEAYRPFFIHGEVATPGQYAYVANMTVENAIAIAGGFGPRADRSKVTISRTINGQTTRASVPLSYPLRPGDTLRVGERWF
jgi:polysaccharide export outer membrane protein